MKYANVVFLDGDNFCKAFAGAQVNLSYSRALQKLSPSRKAIANSCFYEENRGHVTFYSKKSCDNILDAHYFPRHKGSNGILL